MLANPSEPTEERQPKNSRNPVFNRTTIYDTRTTLNPATPFTVISAHMCFGNGPTRPDPPEDQTIPPTSRRPSTPSSRCCLLPCTSSAGFFLSFFSPSPFLLCVPKVCSQLVCWVLAGLGNPWQLFGVFDPKAFTTICHHLPRSHSGSSFCYSRTSNGCDQSASISDERHRRYFCGWAKRCRLNRWLYKAVGHEIRFSRSRTQERGSIPKTSVLQMVGFLEPSICKTAFVGFSPSVSGSS